MMDQETTLERPPFQKGDRVIETEHPERGSLYVESCAPIYRQPPGEDGPQFSSVEDFIQTPRPKPEQVGWWLIMRAPGIECHRPAVGISLAPPDWEEPPVPPRTRAELIEYGTPADDIGLPSPRGEIIAQGNYERKMSAWRKRFGRKT